MANQRDIRRRIKSVQSTQQITKAMKMVSAAKLRRAQERMMAARPYANKMLEVLNSLATRASQEEHPLLALREMKRVHFAIITADKGLCGAFNTNILRNAGSSLEEKRQAGCDLSVSLVGKKAKDYFRRRPYKVQYEWADLFRKVRYEDAESIAYSFIKDYTEEKTDAIFLIYNEFKSIIQQRVVVERLLPIERLSFDTPTVVPDYLYEPTDQELFSVLLPKHVTFQIYRALLESAAAEHAARMTSMEGATKNAKEMIDSLTLFANRVRQAAITKELIEVVSGAQALG